MTTPTTTVPKGLAAKEAALRSLLREYGPMAIAYSGGVDSAYLCEVAHEELGERMRPVLADSPSMPRSELQDACALAERKGWGLTVLQTSEFENEDFLKNDGTRCFYCKDELFRVMDTFAKEQGVAVLAYGEIADDALDPTRYGARAARDHKVVAPLAEAGLFKVDIRTLSKLRGLPTWDKASFACLSSRFPTGTRVEPSEMSKVERAEEALKRFGFHQYRARHHGDLVRVEVEEADLARFADAELRQSVLAALRDAGYRHVTLDLAGYRTGSTAD
ncbi:MAG: ATP-dependent sacrificial sulfur transferase LarE [Candidatus Hydrogenedens sp.]|nr:ATP-dependent sacrificial sulfur transferase LarE [Candidatus Hydrogenedens sp.]